MWRATGRESRHAVARLKEKGIAVSLFVDPDEAQVAAAVAVGADMIEIHTGRFSDASNEDAAGEELAKIIAAAREGKAAGLGVNAGHGLHYHNVGPSCKSRDRRAEHRAQHYRAGRVGGSRPGGKRHDRPHSGRPG